MMSSVPRSAELNALADARMRRLPHVQQLRRAEYPGEVTYLDVYSASNFDLPVESFDGKRLGLKYAVLVQDAYSRFRRVYFCKTQEEVPRLVRFWLLELGTQAHCGGNFLLGYRRRHVHTDGGLPMNSGAFEQVLLECGVAATVTSCPHTPSSNGVVERSFGTLVADVRARLAVSGLGAQHWTWAFRHAVAARNRLASRSAVVAGTGERRFVSPFELFYGRPPDLSHAVVFGSPCRVLLLGPERKGKFGMPCVRGRVLGHGEDGIQLGGSYRYMMGWVVLREDGSITVSRNAEIDERVLVEGGHFPISGYASSRQRDADFSSRRAADEQRDAAGQRDADAQRDAEVSDAQRDADAEDGSSGPADVSSVEVEPSLGAKPVSLAHDPLRRDRASRSKARAGGEQPTAQPTAHARVASSSATWKGRVVTLPRNHKDALDSPEKDEWIAAMAKQLGMHADLEVYREVVVPAGTKILPCRWVFSFKTNADNEVIRFKARTVVWGNLQRQGIDYDETFSPTARGEQIRMLLAAGAKLYGERLGAKLAQAQVGVMLPGEAPSVSEVLVTGDVADAYFNSKLEEGVRVLTEFPPGYVPKLSAPAGSVVVAEQVQAHPGLKQAGRAWYRNNRSQLLKRGFVQSEIAPCIFVKDMPCGGFLAIGVYVDDMLAFNASDNPKAIQELAADLEEHYRITLAPLDKFLGCQLTVTEEGILMHLSQYIGGILERFGMSDCRAASTPERSREDRLEAPDETLLNRAEKLGYQELTGAVMFCMTTCRPDLAHAVGMLARRMSAPRVCDSAAARRVMRYLQGTRDLGILFKFATDSEFPGLVGYADSDWAQDPERRRSTSGYVVLFNGAPISWYSGLQSVTALSSCEAEYISASELTRELVYLRGIAAFIRSPEPGPTTLFEDNEGAIHLVENPRHHRRSKHLEVKWHYIRGAQESGEIKIRKIHTDLNKADVLTKAATRAVFRRHVDALMHRAAQH